MEIWGVGQWTADMIGIFYFADRDVCQKVISLWQKPSKDLLGIDANPSGPPTNLHLTVHSWLGTCGKSLTQLLTTTKNPDPLIHSSRALRPHK